MKNFINDGKTLTHTATAAVYSGRVVESDGFYGIAVSSAALGEGYTAETQGCFSLRKDGTAIPRGAAVYYNAAEGLVSASAEFPFLGYCIATAAALDAEAAIFFDALTAKVKNHAAGLVFVEQPADFPAPVDGVITLEDNITYFLLGTVDLEGDRLVAGQNTTIIGGSSENCRLKSTGLVDALISSEYSLPVRHITIEAALALDLDAMGNVNQALDWHGVNLSGCAVIGTIKDYSNAVFSDCAILDSQGMIFDGTIGTVAFNNSLIDSSSAGVAITIADTAEITRRFRINYCAVIAAVGETAIFVDPDATIPNEAVIFDTVNFSGGGTYLDGIDATDNKTRINGTVGLLNTAEIAKYTMHGNATATTISATGTPVKVAGITVPSTINQKFDHTNNRATYVGAQERAFAFTAIVSLTSGNNNQIGLYIAKNGTPIDDTEMYGTADGNGRLTNIVIQGMEYMHPGDHLEVFVENNTAIQDITVEFLSVIINSVSG